MLFNQTDQAVECPAFSGLPGSFVGDGMHRRAIVLGSMHVAVVAPSKLISIPSNFGAPNAFAELWRSGCVIALRHGFRRNIQDCSLHTSQK